MFLYQHKLHSRMGCGLVELFCPFVQERPVTLAPVCLGRMNLVCLVRVLWKRKVLYNLEVSDSTKQANVVGINIDY